MIPCLHKGPLAQLVEQLTFNQLVGRSNRPRPTIIHKNAHLVWVFLLYIDRCYLNAIDRRSTKSSEYIHGRIVVEHCRSNCRSIQNSFSWPRRGEKQMLLHCLHTSHPCE